MKSECYKGNPSENHSNITTSSPLPEAVYDAPCSALRPAGLDFQTLDLISVYRLDQHNATGVTLVPGSQDLQRAYRIGDGARLVMPVKEVFPGGLPRHFSVVGTFNAGSHRHPWSLVQARSDNLEFALSLLPISQRITVILQGERVYFRCPQLFRPGWHKIQVSLYNNTIRAAVDCKKLEPEPIGDYDFSNVTTVTIVSNDVGTPAPIDLQWLSISCDNLTTERCNEIEAPGSLIAQGSPSYGVQATSLNASQGPICNKPCPPGPQGLKGSQGERGFSGLPASRVPGEKGEKGERGNPGDTGLVGLAGLPGNDGKDGARGPPGPAGLPGTPGIPGTIANVSDSVLRDAKGERGLPGVPGRDGNNGLRGVPGADGIRGEPGRDGAPGLPGTPGQAGPAGPQGEQGERGPEGPQGPEGPRGQAGPPGPPGFIQVSASSLDQGPPGEKGEKGESGMPGLPGRNGLDGTPGSPGQRGLPGLPAPMPLSPLQAPSFTEKDVQNICEDLIRAHLEELTANLANLVPAPVKIKRGPPGRPGRSGMPGSQGYPGEPGLRGYPGETGEPGSPGSPGTNGSKGDKGDRGPEGIGLPGVEGQRGVMGPIGPPGPEGRMGQRGDPGREGSRGPRGVPGPRGSCDCPQAAYYAYAPQMNNKGPT